MHKEKSKKSKSSLSRSEFPGGVWSIFIEDGFKIGVLRIDPDPRDPTNHLGQIRFEDGEAFKGLRGQGYNLVVFVSEILPGAISFHILDAARDYDPDADNHNLFVFVGFYEYVKVGSGEEIILHGRAKVPKGFGQPQRGVGDEGETVNWTSKGPGDRYSHQPLR